MPFKTENKNAFRKVVDLSTTVESLEEAGKHAVNVHLGIYREEIDLEEAVVEVALKTAYVSVEVEGLEIDPGSKYGEVAVPARLVVEHTVTESLTRGIEEAAAVEATVQGSLSPLKAGLDVSMKGQVSGKQSAGYTLTDSRAETRSVQFVEAIGDDRWKIAPEGNVLHGKFIQGQALFVATASPGRPNRRGVAVSVNVRKRDIDVTLTADKRFLKIPKVNKEKMIGLLVARSLSRMSDTSKAEAIVLSRSESFDEE